MREGARSTRDAACTRIYARVVSACNYHHPAAIYNTDAMYRFSCLLVDANTRSTDGKQAGSGRATVVRSLPAALAFNSKTSGQTPCLSLYHFRRCSVAFRSACRRSSTDRSNVPEFLASDTVVPLELLRKLSRRLLSLLLRIIRIVSRNAAHPLSLHAKLPVLRNFHAFQFRASAAI